MHFNERLIMNNQILILKNAQKYFNILKFMNAAVECIPECLKNRQWSMQDKKINILPSKCSSLTRQQTSLPPSVQCLESYQTKSPQQLHSLNSLAVKYMIWKWVCSLNL